MSSYHLTYSGLGVLAACAILLLLPLIQRFRGLHTRPYLLYSQVGDLPATTLPSWRKWLVGVADTLVLAAIALFACALSNLTLLMPPALPDANEVSGNEKTVKTPTEGAALYFVLDVSGSMRRTVSYERGAEELPTFIPKIDLMKDLTERFILGDEHLELPGRPDDLLGLVSFARQADILAPLTLDHDAVIDKLKALRVIKNETDDGTGIGYAIYKTVSTIAAARHYGERLSSSEKPAYTILNTAIILVTDGFQSPSPLDKGNWLRTIGMEDAARYAHAQGVKVYIVNIEPTLNKPEFEPHRHLLTRVAEATGGQFFLVNTLDDLPAIYREIDTLEKNVLPFNGIVQMDAGHPIDPHRQVLFFPYFVTLGMLCIAAAIACETRLARVVP